eukprot:CAMPEP_0177663610 /NCGR_PEP_ID=MMETSP0447-20121125/20013_1 /TAXON_ID=0 /ORGANISM="Stygamoeba regulata, Strain BSH-02190019" /LENGTH=286 /DNA_ID=CAMNT_0019169449 /DNA_START=29 /DNA_END=889 /DNA_ORIENTATION=+
MAFLRLLLAQAAQTTTQRSLLGVCKQLSPCTHRGGFLNFCTIPKDQQEDKESSGPRVLGGDDYDDDWDLDTPSLKELQQKKTYVTEFDDARPDPGTLALDTFVPMADGQERADEEPELFQTPMDNSIVKPHENILIDQQEPEAYKVERDEDEASHAFGRRKRAIGFAEIIPLLNEYQIPDFTINGMPIEDYFPGRVGISHRSNILEPLLLTEKIGAFSLKTNVRGGGPSAQAMALRHAISRALVKWDPANRSVLKVAGFMRRDPREVERKKPGQKKARKKFQWVKR